MQSQKNEVLPSENINSQDAQGKTALMRAAESNQLAAVNALIEQSANLNLTDKDGSTALILAAKNKHTQVMIRLVEAGAKPYVINDKKESLQYWLLHNKDFYSNFQLKLLEYKNDTLEKQLYKAIIDNNIEDLHKITPQMTQQELNKLGKDFYSALICAATLDRAECVEHLIDSGCDVNVNYHGTPLGWAAYTNSIQSAEALLDAKTIDVQIKDNYGKTAADYTDNLSLKIKMSESLDRLALRQSQEENKKNSTTSKILAQIKTHPLKTSRSNSLVTSPSGNKDIEDSTKNMGFDDNITQNPEPQHGSSSDDEYEIVNDENIPTMRF
jgi:ankyrin repeat protein